MGSSDESFVASVTSFLRKNAGIIMMVLFFIYRKWQQHGPMPEAEGADLATFTSLEEFKKFLGTKEGGKVVVVDFYATWCPPCRACAVPFGNLALKHGGEGGAHFAKINVDSAREISQFAGVRSMPTFVIYKGGEEAKTIVGFKEAVIEETTLELLAEAKKES